MVRLEANFASDLYGPVQAQTSVNSQSIFKKTAHGPYTTVV